MTGFAGHVLEAVAIGAALLGTFFFIVGTVGLLRFPDFFCRAHAAAKCDTVGAGLLIVALLVHAGGAPETPKLVLLLALIAVYSPVSTNALARAVFRSGLEPWRAER